MARGFGRVITLASGIAMLLAAPFGCGGSGEGSSVEGSGSPCAGELRDRCGGACVGDSDCGAGLYCGSQGTCTADCTPAGGQCSSGETCSAAGRCLPGGIGDLDGGGDGALPDGCVAFELTFEKRTPTVMLLIDQSGSMSSSFGGGSRWNVLHDALMDANTGVVARLEHDVRFGLALYTSHGGSAGGTCPVLTTVPMKLGNYADIESVYAP
jgi:hypothetical protein